MGEGEGVRSRDLAELQTTEMSKSKPALEVLRRE